MSAFITTKSEPILDYPLPAGVVRFDSLTRKKQPEPCIFCGRTSPIYLFKGKTVCLHCLQHIPAIFRCG